MPPPPYGCSSPTLLGFDPGAESGIVLASSTNIDEEKDKLKMSIRYNEVHDNRNQIPYYNKKYEYNYSPIGSSDCEQDACKNWQMVYARLWCLVFFHIIMVAFLSGLPVGLPIWKEDSGLHYRRPGRLCDPQ